MAMVIGVGFVSCERDDGSEGIEFRMRNKDNATFEEGGYLLGLLRVDSVFYYSYGNRYCASLEVALGINEGNNFYVSTWQSECSITCVGSVSNLGRINRIPESGWASMVSVKPGNGYIIRHKNNDDNLKTFCRYARVYVEDWIESTDGGIIGAVIRYQDNWKIEE